MDFTDAELTQMRESLGLEASATKEDILAAIGTSTDDEGDSASADEPTPAADPAPPTEGTVTVDSATLASLRAQAARGEEARTRQEAEDREALVSAAVRDGRIPPARKEHWVKALEADPGAAASLAGLEPGLIPVGEPVGVGADVAEDPLYVSLFGKDA